MNLYWNTRLAQTLSVATALSIATSATAGGPFDKYIPKVNPPKIHVPNIPLPSPPKIHLPSPPPIHAPNIHNIQLPRPPKMTLPTVPKIELPKVQAPSLPKLQTPSLPRLPVTASNAMNNLTRLPGNPQIPVVKLPSGRDLPVVKLPALPKLPQMPKVQVKLPNPPKVEFPKLPAIPDVNFPTFRLPKPIGSTLPVEDTPIQASPKTPDPKTPSPPNLDFQFATNPASSNAQSPSLEQLIAQNLIQGLGQLEHNEAWVPQTAQDLSSNFDNSDETFYGETPIATSPLDQQLSNTPLPPVQFTYIFVNTTDSPVSYSIRGNATAWGTYHLEPGKHHEYTVKHETMVVRLDNDQEAEVPGEAEYAFFTSDSGLKLATVNNEQ